MRGGDGVWWHGEVISGAAHFTFERPAMRVPVVMMEGGQLEMGVVSGLLVREQAVLGRTGSVGTDGLQISHQVLIEAWQSQDNVAERRRRDEGMVTVDGRDVETRRKRWVWRVSVGDSSSGDKVTIVRTDDSNY